MASQVPVSADFHAATDDEAMEELMERGGRAAPRQPSAAMLPIIPRADFGAHRDAARRILFLSRNERG